MFGNVTQKRFLFHVEYSGNEVGAAFRFLLKVQVLLDFPPLGITRESSEQKWLAQLTDNGHHILVVLLHCPRTSLK